MPGMCIEDEYTRLDVIETSRGVLFTMTTPGKEFLVPGNLHFTVLVPGHHLEELREIIDEALETWKAGPVLQRRSRMPWIDIAKSKQIKGEES